MLGEEAWFLQLLSGWFGRGGEEPHHQGHADKRWRTAGQPSDGPVLVSDVLASIRLDTVFFT